MAAGTVTYRYPSVVNGVTTAPTAAQVANLVSADVTMADASTATTFTHNLSGYTTNGTDGLPRNVSLNLITAGATPVGQGVTISFTTNAIVLTSITTAAGNGGTYRIDAWRHSIQAAGGV